MNRTITRARRMAAIAAIALASVAGTTALAACGQSSDTAGRPSASATAELPAPIIVEPGETAVTATVGETIVFNQPDPAKTTISTDRTDVLELTQGSDDGSAQFNPAAVAQAAGVAVVTIVAADGTTSTVTITVS